MQQQQAWRSILCRATWREEGTACKVWNDMAVDMGWPPAAWLAKSKSKEHRNLVCKPIEPWLLTQASARSLAALVRKCSPAVISAAADEEEAGDVTFQLEDAARRLDAHAHAFDHHCRHHRFKHSAVMLMHSVAAVLHIRNRQQLREVFAQVIKAVTPECRAGS